jgi:Ca-activated chloride channel family protein
MMNIRSDRTLIRAAGRSRRYLLISFTAPVAPARDGRTPINVAFVLDRSGSMGGEKIVLVREAVLKALAMLRPEDRFSLVVYDDRIDVVVGSTPASPEARRNAERQLARIDARGSTDLGGGWLTGCEQAASYLSESSMGRCLLLTDGLANHGITDHDELIRHAGELLKRRIATSTFGVGADFDERLLQGMATAGGGHSYYIERNVQILDYLTSELGEALEVVARDAALEVVLPSSVQAAPLTRYAHERTGNSVRVDLGDIVSAQEVTIVLGLDFPTGREGEQLSVELCLSDRERIFEAPPATVAWRFADHQTNDNQSRDSDVDRAVAELYAARARDEALELNRAGRYEEARGILRRTADRIGKYAAGDPVLDGVVSSLSAEAQAYSAPMEAREMKARYFATSSVMQNRTADGKAKRKQ